MKRLFCVTLTLITMLLMACEDNPTNCGVHYETTFSVANFAHQACNDQSYYAHQLDTCLVEKGGWLRVVKDYGNGSAGFVLVRYDRGPHPKNHCKKSACPDKAELLIFKSTFYPYARRSKKHFKK